LFFGGNIKAACNYAIEHNMDIIAILHSDGQYPAEKINELIKPIEEGRSQVVLGSRFLENPIKGGMPIWRYLGNIFLTKIENVLIGHKLSEWHSGFTAYDCNALRKIPFNLCVDGYEWTTDSLLLFLTKKVKIVEIPIPTHYGKESTSPSIKRTLLYFIHSFKIAFLFFLNRKGIINIEKYNFNKVK
jgi:glycosyltransferase involved in cell wall biosynthesis